MTMPPWSTSRVYASQADLQVSSRKKTLRHTSCNRIIVDNDVIEKTVETIFGEERAAQSHCCPRFVAGGFLPFVFDAPEFFSGMNKCLYENPQAAWYCLIEPCRYGGCGTARIETIPKCTRSMLILGSFVDDRGLSTMLNGQAFMLGELLVLNAQTLECSGLALGNNLSPLSTILSPFKFTCLSHLVVQPSNKEKSKAGGGR